VFFLVDSDDVNVSSAVVEKRGVVGLLLMCIDGDHDDVLTMCRRDGSELIHAFTSTRATAADMMTSHRDNIDDDAIAWVCLLWEEPNLVQRETSNVRRGDGCRDEVVRLGSLHVRDTVLFTTSTGSTRER
jgi:hypothetical protein